MTLSVCEIEDPCIAAQHTQAFSSQTNFERRKMKLNEATPARRGYCSAKMLTALTLALAIAPPVAFAQVPVADPKPADAKPAEVRPDSGTDHTFFLTNATQQNDVNDIQLALRNILAGRTRIYAIPSENAIVLHATPDDIERAQKLIAELDRPRKIYRVTYTFTDKDSGQQVGTQAIVLVTVSGERTIFKQGSKVPIATATYDSDNSKANTEFQYQDVGLSIEVTVRGAADELSLSSKIVQSSLAEEKSGFGPQDPVLHQTVFENTTMLAPGKPQVIGSLGVLGTTRKQEISIAAELIK
jgi:type II secretory pathway component GspD/PulD (secretin)